MPVTKLTKSQTWFLFIMTVAACINFGYAWGWHVGLGIFCIIPYVTRCVNKLARFQQ